MGSGYYGGLFYGQYSQGGVAPAVQEASVHYIIDVPYEIRTIDINAEARVIDVPAEALIIHVPATE